MKDTLKIRKGNENQEPNVVYVTGKNELGYWVSHALNTGDIFLSDDEDLIDFDYRLCIGNGNMINLTSRNRDSKLNWTKH